MVIILLGSEADLEWGKKIKENLNNFGLNSKIHIASAHKTPDHLVKLINEYKKTDKDQVYICVAGKSNALGGFVDSCCTCPVINCPPPCDKYGGMDLLSNLRMPSGVACMTILETDQAALAAAKIISLTDLKIRKKVSEYQKKLREKIILADKKINS
jgi:phosphoribosylaminoimidazole carboxylase PurE protein